MKEHAHKTQLISSQHFGITDLSRNAIDDLLIDFEAHEGLLLQPMIANRDSEQENIYAFTKDPSGYVVELRYIKNPDAAFQHLEKIVQQNEIVSKVPYHVVSDRENTLVLNQFKATARSPFTSSLDEMDASDAIVSEYKRSPERNAL